MIVASNDIALGGFLLTHPVRGLRVVNDLHESFGTPVVYLISKHLANTERGRKMMHAIMLLNECGLRHIWKRMILLGYEMDDRDVLISLGQPDDDIFRDVDIQSFISALKPVYTTMLTVALIGLLEIIIGRWLVHLKSGITREQLLLLLQQRVALANRFKLRPLRKQVASNDAKVGTSLFQRVGTCPLPDIKNQRTQIDRLSSLIIREDNN